jgi:hypothetical protein
MDEKKDYHKNSSAQISLEKANYLVFVVSVSCENGKYRFTFDVIL